MPSTALRQGKTIARTLFGQALLFGRCNDDTVFVIADRCPHRAMPLRHGSFDGENIQCAYHGWRFAASGSCVAIPSLAGPTRFDVSQIACESFACRESQGLIWIYCAPKNQSAVSELPPLPEFEDFVGHAARAAISLEYACDFDNAAFGMIDPAHIRFVHRAWWMKKKETTLREKSKAFEPCELGWRMVPHAPRQSTPFHRLLGKNVRTDITVQLPGLRIERIYGDRARVLNLLAITSIDQDRTQMLQALWWTIPEIGRWFHPIAAWSARRFLAQDGDIAAKQAEGLADNPKTLLISDADTQMRWWQKVVRAWQDHQREAIPFVNPIRPQTLHFRS